jgi:hypothetical protein
VLCCNLLKDLDNIQKIVVTNRDTALINIVAKIFPTFTHSLCWYHVLKNVRVECEFDIKVKDLKHKRRIK